MKTTAYQFLPDLFLRTPYYSFAGYDLLRIPEILQDQAFRNALWLASPVFYQVLERKAFDFERLNDREKLTLAKYYNRMSYRPTPFGAFAAYTLLDWDRADQVRLAKAATLHLLPDQAILRQLNRFYQQDQTRVLRLNPTLYRIGRNYRFIRSVKDKDAVFSYSLEAIRLLPFYTQLFAQVKKTTASFHELSAWISVKSGCNAEEAADHIDFLCQTQVLIGPEQGTVVSAEWPQRLPVTEPLPAHAQAWQQTLPLLTPPNAGCFYAALERPVSGGQADLSTPDELLEVIQAIGLLASPPPPSALQEFTRAFAARYDRAKVPLMEALDPDTGISYAGLSADQTSGVLEAIRFPEPESSASTGWEKVRQLLFRLWQQAGSHDPIRIGQTDLGELGTNAEDGASPSTLALIFRRTEEHLLLEHIGGASANALTGRFSVFGEEAHQLCLRLARQEAAAHPDILFADIQHLSGAATDNINRRRPIYPYQIPVNVFPGTNEQNLALSDLLLSVRNGQLILESARRGKRVIPRLSSAFNFHRSSLAVYRLLCDLQYQGLSAPSNLDLEQLFPGLSHYPRVQYANTILHLAKWHISAADLDLLRTGGETVAEFRARLYLPRHLSLGRDDQQLIFDLAQPEEAAFFVAALSGLPGATLQEYVLPDRSVRTGLEPLAAQFVAFLSHGEQVYRPISEPKASPTKTKRHFAPGSEWLYLKLFCSSRSADELLVAVVLPLLRRYRRQINCWFFIRYNEGGDHLRLRFRTDPGFGGPLLLAFRKQLERSGRDQLVSDQQTGTYTRELERYGPEIMSQAEELFRLGSDLILDHLAEPFCTPMQLAFTTALRMTLAFFEEQEDALAFTARLKTGFLQEFGAEPKFLLDLDQAYRQQKKEIDQELPHRLEPPMRLLLARLKSMDARRHPDRQVLLGDLIHMQLNRTFRDKARQQELLVYYFLNKHLASRIARKQRKEDN